MKRVLLTTLVVFVLGLTVPRNTVAQPARDAGVVRALLDEFLAGASRGDAAVHARFWADDLIYTSAAGRRMGKEDILRDLRGAPAPAPAVPTTVYSAEDVRMQQFGDTALVAFRLVATTLKDGNPRVENYLNTGMFVKRGGRWQAVGWQATRKASSEEGERH